MGWIEDIKEILHARTFFLIVLHHKRQGDDHKALVKGALPYHFLAELADAENKIGRTEHILLIP